MVARAGPATYGPSAATPAGWFRPGFSWVRTNDGWCWGCPQCGVRGVRQASGIKGKAPAGTGVCGRVLCVKLLGRR